MTAYSNAQYAQRDPNVVALNNPVVTIRTGHAANNPHRAPFVSGATAARALFEHARTQLGDANTGVEYFNALRKEYRAATLDTKALDKRLTQRSARAARALSNSDIVPDIDQLQLSVEVAQVQGRIGEKLIPNVLADGLEADRTIDLVDTLTRRGLTNTIEMGEQRFRGEPERPINNWQDELAGQLALARERTGNDTPAARDEDALLVRDLDRLINQLSETIPSSIERPEPLYEIDDLTLDPAAVALTSKRIAENLDQRSLLGDDAAGLNQAEIQELARRTVYQNMDQEEREFLATHSPLDAQQRIEYGLQMIALTPPLVRLPENDLHTGRFDVRMNTQEEAVVMDALLRWAGETKEYPGPEASIASLNSMQPATMLAPVAPENVNGTLGIIVDSTEASVERAREFVRAAPADIRLLIHSDSEAVRNDLMWTRIASLEAAGIQRPILSADGANRDHGGWMLPGANDRILGANAGEHDILIANSTKIVAYTGRSAVKTTSYRSLMSAISKETQRFDEAQKMMNVDRDNLLLSTTAPVAKFGVLAPMISDAKFDPKRFAITVELLANGKITAMDVDASAKDAGITGDRLAVKNLMAKAALQLVGPDGKITPENLADANRVSDVANLTRLLTAQGQSADKFISTVQDLADGKIAGSRLNDLRDQTGIRSDAVPASEKLAQAAKAFARTNGKVPYEVQKMANRLPGRFKAVSTARTALKIANDNLDRYENRDRSLAFDRAGQAGVERAEMISAAYRLDKLQSVFVPARGDERNQIATASGNLVRLEPLEAAISANTILAGADYDRKMLRDALTTGIDTRKDGRPNVTATLVASSNFYLPSKGAEKGLAEITARLGELPPRGVVLIDNNEKNPMVQAVKEWSKDSREFVQATAWRVTNTAESNIERSTKVDFGFKKVEGKPDVKRVLNDATMAGTTVMVSGGGMMDQKTWDAIQAFQSSNDPQAGRFRTEHGLTPGQAVSIVAHINKTTGQKLDMPKIADDDRSANKARAIMQEALVDMADQAIIGTDLGRDYHSANMIRMSAESGKLSAVIDKDGQPVAIADAVAHSNAFAKSMAERTLDDLKDSRKEESILLERTDTTRGFIVLENLGVSDPSRVKALAENFTYLADIQAAAARGDASIPKALAPELAAPSTWKEAADKVLELKRHLDLQKTVAISPEQRAYPDVDHGRVLYTQSQTDNMKPSMMPKIALITGENSKANQTDIAAIQALAADAKDKNHAVSIHLNGELAASAIKTIAAMPDDKRPELLIVTDGHTSTIESQRAQMAVSDAQRQGALVMTATPPLPKAGVKEKDIDNRNPDHPVLSNRETARILHAELAEAVVIVKANAKDPALLSLKSAIERDVPVAAIASVRDTTPAPVREPKAPEPEIVVRTPDQPAQPREPRNPILTIARPLHPETLANIVQANLSRNSDISEISVSAGREPAVGKPAPSTTVEKPVAEPVRATSIDWTASEYSANRKLLLEKDTKFNVPTGHHHTAYEPSQLSGAATGELVQPGRLGDMPPPENRAAEMAKQVTDNFRFTQEPTAAYTRTATHDAVNPENSTVLRNRPVAGSVTQIDTNKAAFAITATQGVDKFIDAIQKGDIGSIRATEVDIARRSRENDDRFLHTSKREAVSSEVRAVFSEMHERAEQSFKQEASATLTNVDMSQMQMQMAMKQRQDSMSR